MKVNDLRVGNYVDYKPDPVMGKSINLGIIDAILPDSIISGKMKLSLKNIDPIPLTEDWLVRFGFYKILNFKFESYPLHPYWAKDGVLLFYNTGQEEYSYLVGFSEMRMGKYYAVGVIWIKHIHQLQNIYYCLTEKELL